MVSMVFQSIRENHIPLNDQKTMLTMRAGRPTKYSPEVVESLCAAPVDRLPLKGAFIFPQHGRC